MSTKAAKRAGHGTPLEEGPGLRQLAGRFWWCVLAGLLVSTSFPFRAAPDSNLWPLAWIGLAPLLWVLEDASPRQGLRWGLLTGFVTNLVGFWWISHVLGVFGHLPAWVAWPLAGLMALYQGLGMGIFGWLLCRLRPRSEKPPGVLRIAAIYTAVELVFPMIFPWYFGNGQYRFLPAIQVAELGGVPAITFVLVAFNAAIYRLILGIRDPLRADRRQVVLGVALAAASLIYGVIRVAQVDERMAAAEKLKLGIVEADIGIWEVQSRGLSDREQRLTLQDNLLQHHRLSQQVAHEGVDLVVWPESSYFPLGDVYGKRSDRFDIAAGASGQIAYLRDMGPGERPALQWSLDPDHPPGKGPPLRAIDSAREDAVAAVGAKGTVLYNDGTGFRRLSAPAISDLFAVSVTVAQGYRPHDDGAPVRIWAVGEKGSIVAGDGSGVERVVSGTTANLRAIAMVSAYDGVIVGDGGTVLVISDGELSAVTSDLEVDLFTAYALPESQSIWFAGDRGTIYAMVAGGWRREQTPVTSPIRALGGGGVRDMWAVGDGGVVLRRGADGRWEQVPFPTEDELVAVASDLRGGVLVAAAGGRGVWHRERGGHTWEQQPTPGLGDLTALAPMQWVKMRPIPKDARYLYQSDAPVPSQERFFADPYREFDLPIADRTAVQRGFRKPVLLGALSWERVRPNDPQSPRDTYNTAVMLDEDGRVVGMYDKVNLLVFGEYMPLGKTFPILYDWVPEAGDFTPGHDVKTFHWRGMNIGVMICYEDILPAFNAKLADMGPNVIINVTNDAWFGQTPEPFSHLALSIFRAVESRLAMVRSTNTGVSAVIDATGRITHQTSIRDPEVVVAELPILGGGTVYGRYGDVLGYGCLVWVVLAWLGRALRRRQRRRGSESKA